MKRKYTRRASSAKPGRKAVPDPVLHHMLTVHYDLSKQSTAMIRETARMGALIDNRRPLSP